MVFKKPKPKKARQTEQAGLGAGVDGANAASPI